MSKIPKETRVLADEVIGFARMTKERLREQEHWPACLSYSREACDCGIAEITDNMNFIIRAMKSHLKGAG